MASTWILRRTAKDGSPRYRVEFRLGGREAPTRYGGSFRTKREADERKRWIGGELAARRVPQLRSLAGAARKMPTLAEAAERWQASRVDISENTRLQHRSAVRAMLPLLGGRRIDTLTAADVGDLVGQLSQAQA